MKQADLLNSFSDFDDFPRFLRSRGADLSERTFVFIDEIQYMSDPSRFLKYLVDHYRPELKFVVSGSSSLAIKKKFSDSMVGRIIPFVIHPLSFAEYLLFSGNSKLCENKSVFTLSNLIRNRGKHPNPKIYDTLRLQQEFVSFCMNGGYPQTSLVSDLKEKEEILSRIYSLYIRKDIKELENIPDTSAFNKLVSLLSSQAGKLIQTTELAAHIQVSRQTAAKYLFLLENTFVVHLCRPFFR
ncbi:MAG: ATP-binding protein [Armatimonadetes bacterium]|nr:ATP-binding protein [Armatimonadota bacterium]